MSFGKFLKDVKGQIRETDVETVHQAVEASGGKSGDGNGAGPIIIDVAEKDEWTEGSSPVRAGSRADFSEQRIEDQVPERSSDLILYCAGGTRSALAARSLCELGYTNVRSMAGGFTAWKRANTPTTSRT
jgi:rhodanese-related sulfurtransferase